MLIAKLKSRVYSLVVTDLRHTDVNVCHLSENVALAAGLENGEQVTLLNELTAKTFSSILHVVPEPCTFVIKGPLARKFIVGDRVQLTAFGYCPPNEDPASLNVVVEAHNEVTRVY